MDDRQQLLTMASFEDHLVALRQAPPDVMGAVQEALARIHGDAVPAEIARAGHAIAAAVDAHGAGFAPGTEPAYHGRYHQAEAILAASWLGAAAVDAGLMPAHGATLLVLAMAGHDLLHDGTLGEAPGALEARSARRTDELIAFLPEPDRAEVSRLILITFPEAMVRDLAGMMAREADLFASFTPQLGWRLSRALAAEMSVIAFPDAKAIASHAGRLSLLKHLPEMSMPARKLGLEAVRSLQLAALCCAGGDACAGIAARHLDGLPPEESDQLWQAALRRLGWPERSM